MLDLMNIDCTDFYFNGEWLSHFKGKVAGKNGFTSFSILPSKEIKTEKVLGIDGEFVYSVNFQPRTFTVPIYLDDITLLREISSWLSVQEPVDFYWKNDTVKIKAMPNELLNIEHCYYQGITDLKFICHNPYFSLITENTQIFNGSTATFTNLGNVKSFPKITFTCSGEISVNINGKTFTMTQVNTGFTIDSQYCTVYNGTNNLLYKFNGDFPIFNTGSNTITVTGACTQIQVLPRSRWI